MRGVAPTTASSPVPQEANESAGATGTIEIAGIALVADCAGALYWPDEGALVVADLHLEKGSSYAMRGVLLPPYDTAATLARLARLMMRYAPRTVIALGDSFHDGGGPTRVSANDRDTLATLQQRRDWIWVAGNHDPAPPAAVGGTAAAELAIGALTFRHLPTPTEQDDVSSGEIAGHLHPVARVAGRGRTVSRRCFASSARRAVMPAFGAYAGGLNVHNRAFADVFDGPMTLHVLGESRVYPIAMRRCLPD